MFEQLRPGETLAVLAEPTDWLTEVRAAFEQAHPADADWQPAAGADQLNIRRSRGAT